MGFVFEERCSDSSVVESVWRVQSDEAGTYTSVAASHWSLLLATINGKTCIELCGPETRATLGVVWPSTDVFGINFKVGAFMPHLPPREHVDSRLKLPGATGRVRAFWLHGVTWEIPTYANADTFADKLVREGALVCDPVVHAVLGRHLTNLSPRAVQYRFLHATGLTQRTVAPSRKSTALGAPRCSSNTAIQSPTRFVKPVMPTSRT